MPERRAILPPPAIQQPRGRHAKPDSAEESAAKPTTPTTPRRGPGRPRKNPDEAKKPIGASLASPNFQEWHDYLGTVVIKWVCRAYIAFAFRGLDRWELLSEAENDALEPDGTVLSDIAKPLAHIAERSKIGKRYGRTILNSSDGLAAFIQLSMWASRVNRIAKKAREGTKENVIESGSAGNSVSGETQQDSQSANVVGFPANPTSRPAGVGWN